MEPTGPAAAAAARARASAHNRQQRQQQDTQQHRTPLRAADAPAASSGQKRSRARSRAPSAAAAGAAEAAAPLPHVHLRPNGKWEVRLGFPHEAGGPRNPNVGSFDSQGEAAVARSLALAFHQHSQGAALSAAKLRLLHTLASLQNQKATLRDVRACSSWQSLRDLLQQWQASGKLGRLAASLTLATSAAAPAAAAAARSARPAEKTVGTKRRSRGRQVQEAQGAAAGGFALHTAAGAAVPMPQRAPRRHAEDAVGRRVRVWLQLDDEVEQQHDGRIVEHTPTRKHHVAYDDGTDGLVDLATAQFRFLPPAASRAAAPADGDPGPSSAAAAAAEAPGSSLAAGAATAALPLLKITSAADVGEQLHVWWPQDRVWYRGVVVHVLHNGMLCVRYELDGMELLVDAADSKVQWVSKARQQLHKRLQRQQEQQRKAAKEVGRAARRAQQRQERQQQDAADSQGQECGGPVKAEPVVEEPPPPAAPAAAAAAAVGAGTSAAAAEAAGSLPDIFGFMMDCAELPEAAAAGFTQELACSFSSLLDVLPPAQQAAKEARLRSQLEQRNFSNAAALACTALSLALAHSKGL